MKKSLENLIEQIAKKHLGIETLETKNSDREDFHCVSVWCLKAALEQAFQAGVNQGAK